MARRNLAEASIYFNVSNSAAELLWGGSPSRYRLLRYEDLVEHPRETCQRIAEFVGEDVNLSEVLDGRTFRPAARHTTWGNPNRFDDEVTVIESDEQWRSKQPGWRSELLRAVNAPLAHRYGYPTATHGSGIRGFATATRFGSPSDGGMDIPIASRAEDALSRRVGR